MFNVIKEFIEQKSYVVAGFFRDAPETESEKAIKYCNDNKIKVVYNVRIMLGK